MDSIENEKAAGGVETNAAARVMELRKQGKRIDTVRVLRPTDEGKLHSVALYVLVREIGHE